MTRVSSPMLDRSRGAHRQRVRHAGRSIVINNLSSIQLPMQVTDKHNLPLSSKGVHFKQIAASRCRP